MKSYASTVDAYLAEAPIPRQAALTTVRHLCLSELVGFDETMAYGMPTYTRNGAVEVAWASQVRYISLYIMRTDVLEPHRGELAGNSVGKGCVRFSRPDLIDFSLVARMLHETAALSGPVCADS